jgi:hypothetical protein
VFRQQKKCYENFLLIIDRGFLIALYYILCSYKAVSKIFTDQANGGSKHLIQYLKLGFDEYEVFQFELSLTNDN